MTPLTAAEVEDRLEQAHEDRRQAITPEGRVRARAREEFWMAEAESKAEGMQGGGDMKRCPSCDWKNKIGTTTCKKCEAKLRKSGDGKIDEAVDSMAKATTPEPFSTSKTSNWVARAGGLPPYIQHVAHDLMEKGKVDESRAIGMAVGIIKNWAHGHNGKGGTVHPDTVAAAQLALKQWEEKKARSHAN